ncbi:MAG: hypothetical protein ACRDKG_06665 [Actinomycetota bacterium]
MRRTQVYLDDDQYRWLKRQAGVNGSIAGVLRDLIDRAKKDRGTDPGDDPLIRHLLHDPPAKGRKRTSVTTIDEDLYR